MLESDIQDDVKVMSKGGLNPLYTASSMFVFCIYILLFQDLLQLENLCKQLYETADGNVRAEAEKALVSFANSPDCLNKCQLLLERGNVSKKVTFSDIHIKSIND